MSSFVLVTFPATGQGRSGILYFFCAVGLSCYLRDIDALWRSEPVNDGEDMAAPDEIRRLIDRFGEHLNDYKSGSYNETQVRREFIDPMFIALGWDVTNQQGHAEAYKDVVHEESLKVGGATKAPDYGFRIGGVRKFFLEAKKPSVNIKTDTHPAYQLRRYAWSAKLPLSIVTDFEEFAAYDCRIQPTKTDKASNARVMYYTFREYEAKWEDIASVFSKEAILKGSFDKYVDDNKKKRGTAEVDEAFLGEIERYRELLAKNIARRNPGLSVRELNFAVQKTIDRIVFLRICEDRDIEAYGRLHGMCNGKNVYPRLLELFEEADQRFNSGLFHFADERGRPGVPDRVTTELLIDDATLKDILKRLYYPDSPYEFSVLPADILGQVYEQFLGHVIELTASGRARVEEKPAVKKAGGVYYTPTYIVDHIVDQTVGPLLEEKNPRTAAKLRILDPACGSGSFLIGAYQYLLDWHLGWYSSHDPRKASRRKAPPVYQTGNGDWQLTLAERKRILLNNIYGVDIDAQAVEVTKLSLLLKVLENQPIKQLELYRERVLPDLGNNIKCGNSLIGPDFYEGQQGNLLGEDELYRVNAFDWRQEFPQIFGATSGTMRNRKRGVDAVIGNPPYIRIQALKEFAPLEVEYYKTRYKAASIGNYDIYVVFVERCLELLGDRGLLGFILPHKFFNAKYGAPLRELIRGGKHLRGVVHFGHQQVFKKATTYTCLLFLQANESLSFEFQRVDDLKKWSIDPDQPERKRLSLDSHATEWNFMGKEKRRLLMRLAEGAQTLGQVAHIFVGLQTSADQIFIFGQSMDIEPAITEPLLKTGKLRPYERVAPTHKILFPYENVESRPRLLSPAELEERYPKAWAHLRAHEEELRAREDRKWDHDEWYAFGRSQSLAEMAQEKLIMQVMALHPTTIFDPHGLHFTGGGSGPFYGLRSKDPAFDNKLLLALCNSSLFGFFVSCFSTPMRGGYMKYSKQYIEKMPVPDLRSAPSNLVNRAMGLVDEILQLEERMAGKISPTDRKTLDRQVTVSRRHIDRTIYDLFGLTDREVRIVDAHAI